LPRMQSLRKAGALTKLAIKLSDAICGIGTGEVLFISHRWENPSSPDTAGKQFEAIREHLHSHPEIKYVWYDFWSMPQRQDKDIDDRSPTEKAEFDFMLSCIADLYLTTKVLILLDNSYVGRFWTMMEAWCAMQMVTAEGVRACQNEAEKRYSIRCIWNADEEFDPPKLIKKLSTKSSQEIHEILSSPDVVLTNAKDKELMLPVISRTNEHVKEIFERVAAVAKKDEMKMKVVEAAKAFVATAEATAAAAVAVVDEAKAAGVADAQLQALLAEACAAAPAIQTLVAAVSAAGVNGGSGGLR